MTHIKDIDADNKILCLRAPIETFEWQGDWSRESKKWTEQVLDLFDQAELNSSIDSAQLKFDPLNPDNDPNQFWMSYEDVICKFSCLNVCKAVNMSETRIKGKFLRI